MANLSLTVPAAAGTTEAYAAANSGGDSFPLPKPIIVKAKNAGGGSIDITVTAQKTCNKGTLHSQVVTVPAGGTKDFSITDVDRFQDAGGLVQFTYSVNPPTGLSLLAY